LAYKAALPTKKELWHQWFNSDDQSDETFLTVKAELEAMGVYKKVQDIALDYVGKAQHCLRLFPDSELKQAFVEFAEYCVLRAF
jgi:geranylgeranyl pyrophosphate synthase